MDDYMIHFNGDRKTAPDMKMLTYLSIICEICGYRKRGALTNGKR